MVTKRQMSIIIGTILGDAYIQPTGKINARLRLEHGEKQKDYIFWKWQELKNLMQDKSKKIIRYNPIYKQTYSYYRCQSHSSPVFGKLQKVFYSEQRKIIPAEIQKILKDKLSLAVWFMDDGYYYHRDKTAYIYLSKFSETELNRLLNALKINFNLQPKVEIKKRGNKNLKFSVKETEKLIQLIKADIIPSMRYKLPNNVE